MRARRRPGGMPVALVLLVLTLSPATSAGPGPSWPPAVQEVSSLEGRGILERVACLACASAFVASGGMTLAGTLFVIGWMAEGAIACAATCVSAF